MKKLSYIVALFTSAAVLASGCGQDPQQTPPIPERCPIDAQTPATSERCALVACASAPACAKTPADTTPPELRLRSATMTDQPQLELLVEINDQSPILDARVAIGGQAPLPLMRPTQGDERTWRALIALEPGQTPIAIQVTDAAGLTTRLNATLTRTKTPTPPMLSLRAEFTTTGAMQPGQPLTADASLTSAPQDAQLLYRWDFGDGALGQGKRTSHTYIAPGEYIITLVVTDLRDGAQSRKLQNVTVEAATLTPSPVDMITSQLQARVRTTTNSPIQDAQLKVSREDGGVDQLALTDALGQASLTLVGEDQATLHIEVIAPGYAPARLNLSLARALELDITLEPLLTSSATITATPNTVTVDQAQFTFSSADLADAPTTQAVQVALATGQPPSTNQALDALGQPQALNIITAAYLSLGDPNDAELTLGINSNATLTLPTPGLTPGDEVTLWRLNDQGVWIEAGTATVTERDGAPVVTLPIFATGWWAIGQPIALDSQLELSCTRAGAPVACAGTITHTMYPGWRAPATAALAGVPAGELCLSATQDLGACTSATTCATASPQQPARLSIELSCPIDTLPSLVVPSTTATQTISAATPKLRWRLDGQAGQGLAIALNATSAGAAFDGSITLSTAQGQRLSQSPVSGPTSGLLLPLPYTGSYIIEVEASGQDLNGSFTLSAQTLDVLSLNELATGVVPSPLTPGATLDRMFYYPGQGALINAAHYAMLDHTTLSFVSAQGKTYTGKPATLIRGQSRPISDVGPVALEQPGYYRIRMSFGQFGQDSGVPYTLALLGLPTPRELSPDPTGRAVIDDELRTIGDRHIFTITLNEGDGVQARLEGLGATALERLSRATLWIGRQGTGSVTQPQEILFRADRDYGFQRALADHTWRAPNAGVYTIELVFFAFEDGDIEPGRYRLIVDKVSAHAGTLRVDPTMQHPEAKTRSLPAALMAASDGAQLLLGSGRYELEVPLKLWRRGVSIIGDGAALTQLIYLKPRIYTETPAGAFIEVRAGGTSVKKLSLSYQTPQGYLPQLNNALIYISSTNSQLNPVQVDYMTDAQVTLEDLKLTTTSVRDALLATALLSSAGERPLPTLTMRRVQGQSEAAGVAFDGESARVEGSQLSAKSASALALTLRAGATITNNTLQGPKALSLTQTQRRGGSETSITDNTFMATSFETSVEISQNTPPADATSRALKLWGNRFDHVAPRYLLSLSLRLRDPATSVSVRANRFKTYQGGAINLFAEAPTGPVDLSQNLIEEAAIFDGIQLHNAQNFAQATITHNTITMGSSCATRAAISAQITAPMVATTALPFTIKHNLVLGTQRPGCAGIGLARPNNSAQSFTLESANNLIHDLLTPVVGPWSSRDLTGELPAQDPMLDPVTLKPQPMSPAIDAVACLPQEPTDIDGTARPQGLRCDVGAHEQ